MISIPTFSGSSVIHSPIRIKASPFVTAQTARVDNKTHIFLANFKGLQARKVDTQIPERNVEIHFSSTDRKKYSSCRSLEKSVSCLPNGMAGKFVL